MLVRGITPGCNICDPESQSEGIIQICGICASLDRVRTFCTKCRQGIDMPRSEGYIMMRIYGYTEIIPVGSAFVIRFEGACPLCSDVEAEGVFVSSTFMLSLEPRGLSQETVVH